MTSEGGKTRRRYGAQFKAMVLAQCDEPGASVAQVAMSHGINDNVVHRWRQLARQSEATQLVAKAPADAAGAAAQFVPLALPAPGAVEPKTEVRLEVRRAAVTVSVAWPAHALGELAGFVRELLK
jgi:transposase